MMQKESNNSKKEEMAMGEQIPIKLNYKLRQIIDKHKNTRGVWRSDSDFVQFILFHYDYIKTEVHPELDNKTICSFICEKKKITTDKCLLDILKKYNQFIKNENTNNP